VGYNMNGCGLAVVQVMTDIPVGIMSPRSWLTILSSALLVRFRFEVIAELLANNLMLGSKRPTPDD
jgi:hypothetical protein